MAQVVACLALQEIAASPNQLIALQRIGLKFGYKFFFSLVNPALEAVVRLGELGVLACSSKPLFLKDLPLRLLVNLANVWVCGLTVGC